MRRDGEKVRSIVKRNGFGPRAAKRLVHSARAFQRMTGIAPVVVAVPLASSV